MSRVEGGKRKGLTGVVKMDRVPLINCIELQMRFLSPSDTEQVKVLCRSWFPIEYPDTWYQEITANPRFFSLAATLQGRIIGIIVAETKELGQLAKEDRTILANCFRRGTKVAYILSLGVCEEFRKQGIASLLLENLISHLTSEAFEVVKACTCTYSQRIVLRSLFTSIEDSIYTP